MPDPRAALSWIIAVALTTGSSNAAEDEPGAPIQLLRSGVEVFVSQAIVTPAATVAETSVERLLAVHRRFDPDAERDAPPFTRTATIRIFATHEERGLLRGSEASFAVDEAALSADVVAETGVTRQCGRAEALLYLVGRFGKASALWLEDGASYALADEDAIKDYRATAAWIEDAGEATALADLIDEKRYERRSALLQSALAAVLVELILEEGGPPALVAAWRGAPIDQGHLGPRYRARLRLLKDKHRHWMDARRAERGLAQSRTRHRGVCFAHEGYRIRDGYLSAMARRSMERAHQTGARALSLTPFAYYPSPTEPELRWPRRTGLSAGRESDESILVASSNARALAMTTMLKPHLWGHGWCGTIQMQSEADWDAWFSNYAEFLLHNALLAERAGIDWLSIGCELVLTTADNSDRWRALAQRARRVFAGGLCYSANWGEEMQQIGFADALDAVGVDFYFPLSDKEHPSDDELREGAMRALTATAALREKYQRPILLTEIGYPSRAAPWKAPYEVSRGQAEFAALQARCLLAFADAFRAQTGVDGFYIWKWPTFDQWSDRERVDYWPAGEASMTALESAFTQIK